MLRVINRQKSVLGVGWAGTRRRWALLVVVAVVAAIVSVSGSARTGPTGPTSDLAALRICGKSRPVQPVARYRYAILQAWEYRQIRAIKRRSPGTKVLVYKDIASTRDDARRADVLPTGVSYAYANRRHPEWFLRDTQGRRVSWSDWPHAWQMDVGSRSYQRAWGHKVAAELRHRGWDGVFLDNVAASMQYPSYLNGRVLARYPGASDYQRATYSFLRNVGPALRRRHLLAVGNINDARPDVWSRWVSYLSGAAKEWWTKSDRSFGRGALSGADWTYQMRLLRQAQAKGKAFVAIAYGRVDDLGAMQYARASFLLFARGSRSALTFSTGCDSEPPALDWRQNLGIATNGASRVGVVWRRTFVGGTAVVNPTADQTVTLPLGGSYLNPSGTPVTSVVLPPHSGLVLRRAS
jgi:Hypothetical glycosyl hydrolase family 15